MDFSFKPDVMKYNTILQIDDDIDDCEFFQDALSSVSKANYISINNPLEALKKLLNFEIKPDLILLDINMPKMDGYTLLDSLRKDASTREIPVILFSTSPNEDCNKTCNLNILEYIVKPYSFQDLKNLVKRLLDL